MAIESITTHQRNALRSMIRMTMQRNAILTMLHRIGLLLATLLWLQRTSHTAADTDMRNNNGDNKRDGGAGGSGYEDDEEFEPN